MNEPNWDVAEPIRCSTPLHLPCPIEFSLPAETSSCLLDESFTDDGFALLEGSNASKDSFQKTLVDFVVRHKLSDNAVKELLRMLQRLLPTPNNVPNRDGS